MQFKTISQFCVFLALLSFIACQADSSHQTTAVQTDKAISTDIPAVQTLNFEINPPLENIDVAYQEFTLEHQEAQTIELENGSTISVPAQAFVHQDGSPVQTPVSISYREFHNAAEIITSGIPMHLTTEDGQTEWMQTAGMFEIKGFAEGRPVFIAEGKTLTIDMASEVDGVYDFWYLDEDQNNWARQGSAAANPNPNTLRSNTTTTKLRKPVKPVAFDKSKPSLNFDLNYDAFPELKDMQGVIWQYAGQEKDKDPNQNEWIYDENWTDIELTRASRPNTYQLSLTSDQEEYSILVTPSQKGLDYESSMEKYQRELAAYKAKADMKDLRKQQAEFVRNMRINRFGIYNYDIMWKAQNAVPLLADFDFGDMPDEIKEQIVVYLITGNRRAVVSYPSYDWKKFRFDPEQDNRLMAVLPGNRIATFTQKDFERHMPELKAAGNQTYRFKMNIQSEPVKTVAQVDQAIL